MRGALIGPAVFAAAVASFAMPAAATAAIHPPAGNEPGVAQYTETLPSAGGGEAVGSSSKAHKLPPKIQAKLKREGGSAAASLQVIASSSTYGAPQTKLRTVSPRPRSEGKKPAVVPSQAVAASGGQADAGAAASAAATSAGHGYVLAVVLALVLLTAAAAAITVSRRRRRSA